tara:strand:+ start:641 stop:880 length:240 start_codon:yes stop_codon:yes gene_type:complete
MILHFAEDDRQQADAEHEQWFREQCADFAIQCAQIAGGLVAAAAMFEDTMLADGKDQLSAASSRINQLQSAVKVLLRSA